MTNEEYWGQIEYDVTAEHKQTGNQRLFNVLCKVQDGRMFMKEATELIEEIFNVGTWEEYEQEQKVKT